MKRIVTLLLGLLLVFAACTALAETVTAKPGDELSFDISISDVSGTDAKIGLKINGAPVEFVSATGGPTNDVVPPKSFDGFFVLVNDGGITIPGNGGSISGAPTGPKTLESGKIGTVTFEVGDAAVAGQTYTVEAYKKDGSVTVTGSITFTIEGTTSGDRLAGDANEDGKVNARDALLIAKYAAGWEGLTINLENAEVNEDGKVNARDALAIAKYAAGWDVVLK